MRRSALTAMLLGAAAALAACTSTQDVLEPSALVSTDTPTPPPQTQTQLPIEQPAAQPPAATASQPPATVAAINTNARVQFAPVVGASGEASTPLAARLSTRASARGITLVGAGESSATHVMKGYFSAFSDDGQTTVIYVWDVMDPAGTRVHRIQGQASAPSRGGEGWPSVDPSTMETIADRTVDDLATWLAGRPG
jgi:ABC-type Fe3+-hydroxamate transport system substrate-binding protein